ncbi:MAG: protein kinase [Polyangiaceae bacterium]
MSEVEELGDAITLHDAEVEGLQEDDLVGLTLRDTYSLTRLMGQGGMARVYEAQHTRIPGKRFAVKVLRQDMASQKEIAARFEREAHAIASVEHPNIVDVIDIGISPSGRPYIVTEYLDGTDLANLIDRVERLDPLAATHIARQVCRGIAAAHACGVIHRDLKPDNVFLSGDPESPEAKVLDFGLARLVETGDASLTRSGIVMGTPSYMSPEQARAESADERSDVYGIGALLYVALTGVAPYSEASPQETVLAVMAREPPRPRALTPSIPKRLEAIVQRAMARDPRERFATAAELEGELQAFEHEARAAEMRLSAPPPSLVKDHARATEHDRTRVVALIALGASLVTLWLSMAVRNGLEIFVLHRPPTAFELVLSALAILGTVATPLVLAFRYLRRRVWHNSARVAELLARTRATVYSALVAYGLAALAVRAHRTWVPHSGRGHDAAWAGWDALLCATAVWVGLAVALRGNLLAKRPGRARKLLAGPVLGLVALAGIVAIMGVGFVQPSPIPERATVASMSTGEPAALGTQSAAPPPVDEAPIAAANSAVLELDPPTTDAAPLEGTRATLAELDAAKRRGLAGWQELSRRHPADPHVLQPLALAYGRQPEHYGEALTALVRLFTLDPVLAKDVKIRGLMLKLALTESTGARAMNVMGHEMGAAGPDLLYDLYVTMPAVRDRARDLLRSPAVRQRASAALTIAFDLRSAPNCEARLALLPRANAQGDERSAATLIMLSNPTQKGCGYKKRRPCPPPCSPQAAAFRETIAAIHARTRAAARRP